MSFAKICDTSRLPLRSKNAANFFCNVLTGILWHTTLNEACSSAMGWMNACMEDCVSGMLDTQQQGMKPLKVLWWIEPKMKVRYRWSLICTQHHVVYISMITCILPSKCIIPSRCISHMYYTFKVYFTHVLYLQGTHGLYLQGTPVWDWSIYRDL